MPWTRNALLGSVIVGSLTLVPVSTSLSYLVRSITAIVAVVVLLRIAKAPGRTSRILMACALLTGIASGLVATGYLLGTGHPSPPGGAADWLYLAYAPFVAAGLLMLPKHPTDGPSRLLALVDALITLSALGFLLIDLLGDMARHSGSSLAAKVAALGYPVAALFVLSVLLSVIARAEEDLRPFLRTAGAGLALLAVSDIAYSVGTLHHWYTPTSWPAVCSQAGLLLIVLSPMYGRRTVRLVEHEPEAPSLLESAAPVLTLVPGTVLLAVVVLRGGTASRAQLLLVVVTAVAMVTRGLLTGAEQRYTVARLRVREREAVMTARRDPLTGLDNRTAMHDRLASLLADRGQLGIALALLDLDDFKDINDTHGHDTGDAVLREVARRLCVAAPAGALVARLGGDEFAVCVPAPAGPHSLGDALLDAFRQPVVIGTRPFTITASIGVVMADADGGSAAVALSHVDVAMYQAKARKDPHRSGVVVLNGQAREHAAARVQMRDDVSHPQVDQFHVVYEPVVDLRDGRVVGAEALLRWDHPLLGRVAPADFIPLAEQVGAIAELGEFALRTAVADLASWLATAEASGHPLADGSVGVNLSPRQLGVPGLCDLVQSILAEHHLEPNRLVLEITEEALLDDWSTAIEVVQGLRSIGVGVAVDDFGTGYSSLRYLRRFDTSIVKIDREFVQAVVDEPRTRALVASVLEMARSLELSSVAEGIETLDQLQVLRALGCRLAQGYLFDKPMRAQAFGALLVDGHRYPMGAHPQSVAVPLPSPRSADLAVLPRQTG